MKIVHVGAIITGIVITMGVLLIMPEFFRPSPTQPILLSFSITDEKNLPTWCHELSAVLAKNNIKAAVFVIGKVAERHPDCVSGFPSNVDIGTESYDYVALPSISDYTTQLEEVKSGKAAVDKAGNLDTKLFRAPYGATDINTYSLLNRSSLLADFSYSEQYNKYYEGKFIKFDLVTYNGTKYYTSFFRGIPSDEPVLVNFDNSTPVNKISDFISEFKYNHFNFVSATDLTLIDLTVRGEKTV